MMFERHVKLFKNCRNQAVRIPREFGTSFVPQATRRLGQSNLGSTRDHWARHPEQNAREQHHRTVATVFRLAGQSQFGEPEIAIRHEGTCAATGLARDRSGG
jgi:hypothetical protein